MGLVLGPDSLPNGDDSAFPDGSVRRHSSDLSRTGTTTIMDVGNLRLPTRGWFLPDTSEDMELNGAMLDQIVWPDPAEFARGASGDSQIARAVEVLSKDVKEDVERPRPRLRKANERDENRRGSPMATSGSPP
jgi:hypothetical protein